MGLRYVVGQPFQGLRYAFAGQSTAGVNLPSPVLDVDQSELAADTGGRQRARHVLLVGQHQERRLLELLKEDGGEDY